MRNDEAPGFDGITAEVLKIANENLSPVISELINRLFELEIFPNCVKLAKDIHQSRKVGKTEVSNFQPFSILPLVSRECTPTLSVLIKSSQIGHRRKRSTVDAIIQIIKKTKMMSRF